MHLCAVCCQPILFDDIGDLYCTEAAERRALDIDTLKYFVDEFDDRTGLPWSEFMLRLCDPWDDFVDIKVLGNVFDNPEYVKQAIDEYNAWLKR